MKRLGRTIGLASELGLAMGLTASGFVVVGLLLGRWVDARLGTRPVATLVSLVAGAIIGQIAIYRLAMRSTRRLSTLGDGDETVARISTSFGKAAQVLGLMLLPVVVGLGLGLVADALLGTGARLTVALPILGSVVGLFLSVRAARKGGPSLSKR